MRAIANLAWLFLAGCGYHLTGAPAVPEGAGSVSIRLFQNRTHEDGLEVALRRALVEEFRRRGTLHVAPGRDGDLVLSGEIRRFASIPVAFSATDEAVEYQGVIQVAMRLVERRSKRVLYETGALQVTQDFGAVGGVVITSSPRFQRGTIDARDLANLTNVQLGEARRQDAVRGLLELLARNIYLEAMEGF